jgi:hypothetical protein
MTQLNGPGDPDGAITYRVDPRTGNYRFYRTDIKPRGVFLQNTFQHPAPPLVSALGVPIGKRIMPARGRSKEPYIPLRAGLGCGACASAGRCAGCHLSGVLDRRRRRRGLGDSTSILSPDASVIQLDDGTVLDATTGAVYGVDGSITDSQGNVLVPGTSKGSGIVQTAAAIANSVKQAVAPRPMVTAPAPVSWWDQSTMIGGSAVSNPVLAGAAVGFAFLLSSMGKGRR